LQRFLCPAHQGGGGGCNDNSILINFVACSLTLSVSFLAFSLSAAQSDPVEAARTEKLCILDEETQVCFREDAIYLGSGTGAVDGRGWLCETVLLLPATGQTGFGLPFPAIDVFHSGYSYVSSPTPNGTLGPYWFYGLERMCVVLSSGERRLPGLPGPPYANSAWRGTPVEAILQPTSGDIPDQMKRVRELTVYDANGSAMRFLAFISQPNDPSPYREQWEIVPTRGVNATLTADVDETGAIRGFTLVGGPPGRIREGGRWVYHFARPVRDLGWGGAFKSRLHDNITILGGEVRSSPAIFFAQLQQLERAGGNLR